MQKLFMSLFIFCNITLCGNDFPIKFRVESEFKGQELTMVAFLIKNVHVKYSAAAIEGFGAIMFAYSFADNRATLRIFLSKLFKQSMHASENILIHVDRVKQLKQLTLDMHESMKESSIIIENIVAKPDNDVVKKTYNFLLRGVLTEAFPSLTITPVPMPWYRRYFWGLLGALGLCTAGYCLYQYARK
jgi:hypothetical protein